MSFTAAILRQDTIYARFGTALADLGDLNKDGYPEVAISAPYGDQAGTVYIYSGTSQGVLSSSSHPKLSEERMWGWGGEPGLEFPCPGNRTWTITGITTF